MSSPAAVRAVLERLAAIDAELSPADGAAVFNRVYRRVTERFLAGLESGADSYADPAFAADLDVRFAQLWFDAYDAAAAGAEPSAAWAPLLGSRSASGVVPLQFALSGMNAHIEHDLPLAVVATCEARGRSPYRRAVRDDYETVNGVLASVEAEIRRDFLSDLGKELDDEVGALVHLVGSWQIDKARDVAWVTALTIWSLRRTHLLLPGFLAALAQTVGMASRALLTPVAPGLAAR